MWSTIKGCVFWGVLGWTHFPALLGVRILMKRFHVEQYQPQIHQSLHTGITHSLSNHFKKPHAWVPWALDGCVHRTQLPGAVLLCVVNSWSVQLKYFEIGQGDVIFGKHRMTFWQPNKNKAPLKLDKIQKQTGTAERKWMCRNECLLWVLFEKSALPSSQSEKKPLKKSTAFCPWNMPETP